MNFKATAAVRNAMAQALLDAMNAGSGPGKIKFYTTAQPAGPGTAITDQTLLGTLICSDPAGTISGGVLTFSAITQDSSADASGTATWARITDSDDNAVWDIDVTNTAGSGGIKLNTTTIVSGGPIQVTSLTITMPGG